MKNESLFFNPFRIISPRLDAEASRLTEMFESRPEGVTSLEEGLLVMTSKLIELAVLARKSLILADSTTFNRSAQLAHDIHEEEKKLTGDLVTLPMGKSGPAMKAVLLFPGHLERVGDSLESIVNVSRIKDRNAVPFSDKGNKELDEMFALFTDMLKNFRDALLTRNKKLLETIVSQEKDLGRLIIDFSVAHEDRLLECQCSPKASSLYLDILDSIKNASYHVRVMSDSLLNLSASEGASGTN